MQIKLSIQNGYLLYRLSLWHFRCLPWPLMDVSSRLCHEQTMPVAHVQLHETRDHWLHALSTGYFSTNTVASATTRRATPYSSDFPSLYRPEATMATMTNNRYALFDDPNENAPPKASPVVDPSRNPFLNQVADESGPWQEVKKRGAASAVVQLRPTTRGKILVVRDQTKATFAHHDLVTRARTVSSSTMTSDKAYDPHENWCGVCSQKFSTKPALLSHIKQALEDHKHYCNLCKRVFKDHNGLKNHLRNSYGHDVYCNLCFSAFNNEYGLKNHFENNYAVDHQYVCLTCLLGFRTQGQLDRHLQTAEKHTWCESCCRQFRNQDERDEHWQKTMSTCIVLAHRRMRSFSFAAANDRRTQTLPTTRLRL